MWKKSVTMGPSRRTHALPFAFSMMLPAFRGVSAIRGVKNLVNPRGFVLIDKNQRNPNLPEYLQHRRDGGDPAHGQDACPSKHTEDWVHDRNPS